jgi:hypothetical protein
VESREASRTTARRSLEAPLGVRCGGISTRLEPYRTVLIPAAANPCSVSSAHDVAAFSFVTPELVPEALRGRMLAGGVAAARVDAFLHQFVPFGVAD